MSELENKNVEVEETKSEQTNRGVIDPTNSDEPLLEYDFKCKDCGSYHLDQFEEEQDNGTIVIRKKCLDCGSTNIIYGYSDAVIECGACGHVTRVEHPGFINVRGGINIPPLYTTNKHFVGLGCSNPECKNSLVLKMVPAANPPEKEEQAETKEKSDKPEYTPKLEVVTDEKPE